MSVTCIHQPPFLPWLGIIESMMVCDYFVLHDDIQFDFGGWQNRNKILTAEGTKWLTVSIKNNDQKIINKVLIAENFNPKKILKFIQSSYGKAPFYKDYKDDIEELFLKKYELIVDINKAFLFFIHDLLNAKCEFVFSSELGIEDSGKTRRLVDICKHFTTTHYYSGSGTKGYVDLDQFKQANIEIVWHDYEKRHEIYPQANNKGEFVPGLSYLDMLFNCGAEEVRERLLASGQKKLQEYNAF